MKVVIADAHDLFRCLLKFWINSERGMRLVGDTNTGGNVVELVSGHNADLLIIDPMLSELSGFAIAQQIHEELPNVRMIAVYNSNRPFIVDKMQKAGFHGCICKMKNSLPTLRQAIDSVMDGNAYYCAETCRVQNIIYNDKNSFARLLSAREQQILTLVGSGMDNEEIGANLKLSPATVQTHRRNLFKKLGIHDTPALMRYALEQGFWQTGTDISDMEIFM